VSASVRPTTKEGGHDADRVDHALDDCGAGWRLGANELSLQQATVIPAGPGLDVRMPPPDPVQERAIRESRDWRNLWLDVSNDGYRLKSISALMRQERCPKWTDERLSVWEPLQ
jgi:hypothetical protein